MPRAGFSERTTTLSCLRSRFGDLFLVSCGWGNGRLTTAVSPGNTWVYGGGAPVTEVSVRLRPFPCATVEGSTTLASSSSPVPLAPPRFAALSFAPPFRPAHFQCSSRSRCCWRRLWCSGCRLCPLVCSLASSFAVRGACAGCGPRVVVGDRHVGAFDARAGRGYARRVSCWWCCARTVGAGGMRAPS